MMTAGITCTRVAIAEYQLYNNSMSTTNWIVTTLLLHSITHTFRHLFTWLAAGRAMHGGWKRAVCTHQHAAWLAPSSVQALTRARFWPPGCQVQIPHPVCLPVAILLSCSVSAAMHGHVNSITPQVCMSSLNTSEFCQVEGHNCPESQRLTWFCQVSFVPYQLALLPVCQLAWQNLIQVVAQDFPYLTQGEDRCVQWTNRCTMNKWMVEQIDEGMTDWT